MFAEFAASELLQQLHRAVIEATQRQRLFGHTARDATAILVREHLSPTVWRNKQAGRKRKPKPAQGSAARAKVRKPASRIQRQRRQELDIMPAELPRQCDLGAKKNSQGHLQYWRGYKLHLDVG